MPLILPSQRVIRPNPLAYPAGAVPGIDWSHPASGAIRFSAIAAGSNFVSLRTGQPGILLNTPTSATHGLIGPAMANVSNTTGTYFVGNGGATTSDPNLTMAGIVTAGSAIGGSFDVILANNPFNGANGVTLSSFSGSFSFNNISGSNWSAGVTPTAGRSFFYAVSASNGGNVLYAITDLATGVVLSGVASGGSYSTASNPTLAGFFVANWSEGGRANGWDGRVAATMYSARSLTLPQLQAWANDPWAFWYPNKTINLASAAASAGGGFLAAWARNSNLPVIGTGNY